MHSRGASLPSRRAATSPSSTVSRARTRSSVRSLVIVANQRARRRSPHEQRPARTEVARSPRRRQPCASHVLQERVHAQGTEGCPRARGSRRPDARHRASALGTVEATSLVATVRGERSGRLARGERRARMGRGDRPSATTCTSGRTSFTSCARRTSTSSRTK